MINFSRLTLSVKNNQVVLFKVGLFLLIPLLIIFISTIFSASVFALEGNFDSPPIDSTIWQVYQNAGLAIIDGGVINLSAGNTKTFPYIHSKSNPIPTSGDFSVKFRMRYNSATTKGTGLILATEVPPNGSPDPPLTDSVFSRRYLLGIWQSSLMGFYLQYAGDCYNQSCSLEQVLIWEKGSPDLDYHTIQFQYSGGRYLIYLDGINVFTSNPTSVRPTAIWFGNPSIQGPGDTWTNFELDYIYVTPLLPPLILLPGLGASWNYRDMILGIPKPPADWYMTPFVKTYDGLIQTLKNAGYSTEGENKNLYIFNYNWTKPVNSLSDDLKDFIDNVVDPLEGTEIDLVGHSLGGLVARTYVQNTPDHQVDQLITVGSPHKGVVKVYYIWEGAELSRALSPWQTIAAGILLRLKKQNFENKVEAVQHLIPSLQDLLPTFNYLRKGTIFKPLSEMKERNHWLENFNQPPLPNSLISVLNNLVGLKGENTHRWIVVGLRNPLDKILGKWVDGRPVGQFWGEGDNTVLAESAQLPGANVIELTDIGHRELVETATGQQAIIDLLLGPQTIEISLPSRTSYAPALVFQLASPASLAVYDPDGVRVGEEYPDDKLVIVFDPEEGEYRAEVSEEGDGGPFRLLIGKILPEDNLWEEFEGETAPEPQTFTTQFTQAPQPNKLELLNLAKEKLELAREKILSSTNRFRFPLAKLVELRIDQIEKAISFLQRGKEKQAQNFIKSVIWGLDSLGRKFDRWQKFLQLPPELKAEIEKSLGLAKDYLIQAYELE